MKNKLRKESAEKEEPSERKDGEQSAGGGPGAGAPEAGGGTAPQPSDAVLPALDDRLLRLQADFENFRKRTQRERAEIALRANEGLMRELLPVLDHLDLAFDAAVQHHAGGPVIEGVKMVCEQLLDVLGKFGLSPVDAGGQDFDPNVHEAISHLPAEDVPANRVMTQVRRGFRLGTRLLRPAQVVVSSGPAGAAGGKPAARPPAEG